MAMADGPGMYWPMVALVLGVTSWLATIAARDVHALSAPWGALEQKHGAKPMSLKRIVASALALSLMPACVTMTPAQQAANLRRQKDVNFGKTFTTRNQLGLTLDTL
mgnify:CR=1 FL=1